MRLEITQRADLAVPRDHIAAVTVTGLRQMAIGLAIVAATAAGALI